MGSLIWFWIKIVLALDVLDVWAVCSDGVYFAAFVVFCNYYFGYLYIGTMSHTEFTCNMKKKTKYW